ncbi:MAG: HD-GYP domain-containing protein [Bacillota bacterium]|nr:HD-GYP domain-containing protein [Bacillota bacterium]
MKYVSNKELQPGMCVARPIYGEDGQVLLNSGVILNESYIARLYSNGVPGAFILTDHDEEVEIPEVVTQRTRQNVIGHVRNVFESIELGKTFDMGYLTDSVTAIIDEVTANPNVLINLTDIRTFDGTIFAHCVNVCILSIIIGIKCSLNELELRELAIGSILHDIGKICIPTQILQKQGPLTQNEFDLVKKHTVNGWNILRNNHGIPLLSAHIAYQHHEQPNGKGYPRELLDEQIYLFAKIVAVADAYDAMTSARVYRQGMMPFQALRVIRQLREIQFNAAVADLLISSVAPYPIGARVLLSNAEIGVVVDVNAAERERPVVRLLFRADGSKYQLPREVNLMNEPSLRIIRSLP